MWLAGIFPRGAPFRAGTIAPDRAFLACRQSSSPDWIKSKLSSTGPSYFDLASEFKAPSADSSAAPAVHLENENLPGPRR